MKGQFGENWDTTNSTAKVKMTKFGFFTYLLNSKLKYLYIYYQAKCSKDTCSRGFLEVR